MSHSVIAQLFGGLVILQYNIRCGSAAGGLWAMVVAIGRVMRIVYFFSVGVTSNVPGGMLACGHHLAL